MKKLLSTLLSVAIFATLTTPAFAERELTVADGDLWSNLVAYWQMNAPEGSELSSADTSLWNGLLSYWKFNEANGDLIDIKSANNGTNNGANYGANGVLGDALSFDGSNDYISIPDNDDWDFWQDSKSFTAGGWVKFDSIASTVKLLGHGSDGDNRFGLAWTHGPHDGIPRLFSQFEVGGASETIMGDNWTPVVGQWHHILYLKSDTSFAFYADGNSVGSGTLNKSGTLSGDLTIGATLNSSGVINGFLNGSMDDIGIWDRALTQEEIDDLYQRGTIEDEKGTNDGQDNGALSITGKLNDALSFDGNDGITISTANFESGSEEGAMSFWFKTGSSAGNINVISSADHGGVDNYIMSRIDNGAVEIYLLDGPGDTHDIVRTTSEVFNDDNWHHAVISSDGSSYSIYVDGNNEALTIDNGGNNGRWFGDITLRDSLTIGYRKQSSSINFFDGSIDDVTIYDRALTPTEILQLYNMGVSPVDADTEYTGTGTTDFESETNMTSVPSVILNKADGSGVAFSTLTPMNAENKDYDDNVKMGHGYITVNSTANPELDRAATVTMNVNTCNNLAIYKDDNFIEDSGSYPTIKDRIMAEGTECTIGNSCLTTAPTCSGNTATFYVTGFSSFAGEGSGGSSVPEFSDYMLMLTFLIAGFALYRRMPELQK